MEHNFHGPSYTLGIEEELMIVDGESYALVNAIESLLEDAPELVRRDVAQEPLAALRAAGAAPVPWAGWEAIEGVPANWDRPREGPDKGIPLEGPTRHGTSILRGPTLGRSPDRP